MGKKVEKKKVEKKKEEVKEEVKKVRKLREGSRPHTLFECMKKEDDLEKLLENEALLKKFNGMKSWIRHEYEKLKVEFNL